MHSNKWKTYICMIMKLFLILSFVYMTINIHMVSNHNNISFSFQGQYIIYDWLLTWRANTYEIVNFFFWAKVGNLCLASHCRSSLELVLHFFHLPFLFTFFNMALQVFVPTINPTFYRRTDHLHANHLLDQILYTSYPWYFLLLCVSRFLCIVF